LERQGVPCAAVHGDKARLIEEVYGDLPMKIDG